MAKAIRETEKNRETPILVADTFSAKGDRFHGDVAARCLEAGATEYFPLRENNALNELIKKIAGIVS